MLWFRAEQASCHAHRPEKALNFALPEEYDLIVVAINYKKSKSGQTKDDRSFSNSSFCSAVSKMMIS